VPKPIQIEPDAWCAWCGETLPEEAERHPRRRYCSRQCKDEAANARAREEWAATLKTLDCPHCGTTFKQGRACQVYCSIRCQDNARYRRRTRRPVAVGTRHCVGCNVEFTPRNLAQTYCTTPCRVRAWNRAKG
jgi:hypothetical protein